MDVLGCYEYTLLHSVRCSSSSRSRVAELGPSARTSDDVLDPVPQNRVHYKYIA